MLLFSRLRRSAPVAVSELVANDLNQANVRFWVGLAVVMYIVYVTIAKRETVAGNELGSVLAGSIYVLIAYLIKRSTRRSQKINLTRRLLGLLLDTIAPTVVLSLMSSLSASLLWLHLFVTTGHGVRYGPKWLYGSQAMSLAGVIVVALINPYW